MNTQPTNILPQDILKSKLCPRCSGKISLESDSVGNYLECIFCGYTKDIETISPLVKIDEVNN